MPTILIVDDHEDNRMVLSKLLSHSGFAALTAPDGASALEQVRAERPDLALVDLLMPVVDGFEFVYRLRHEDGPHAATPVIFITAAYLPTEVRPLAETCGVSIVLARPTTYEDILKAVNEALSAPPPVVPPGNDREFRLELLRLLSRTLSHNLKSVIPKMVEYLGGDAAAGETVAPPDEGS